MEPRPIPDTTEQQAGSGAGERAAPATGRRSPVADSAAGSETGDMLRPDASQAGDQDGPSQAVSEMEDRWRRAAADLDNYRKRCMRDLAHEVARERDRVAAAWLPILDSLDRALTHARAEPDAIVEGVRAIRDQAIDVLTRLGYARHGEVNVPFDPNRHEVVTVIENPHVEPGTVVQVLHPGYGDGERQLRPAAVAVNQVDGGDR